jgi:hypothetical protein
VCAPPPAAREAELLRAERPEGGADSSDDADDAAADAWNDELEAALRVAEARAAPARLVSRIACINKTWRAAADDNMPLAARRARREHARAMRRMVTALRSESECDAHVAAGVAAWCRIISQTRHPRRPCWRAATSRGKPSRTISRTRRVRRA